MISMLVHVLPIWIELLSLAFCIGALVCRLVVYEKTFISMRWLFGFSIAAMTVGSIAELLLRSAEMSGRAIASFPVLFVVLFKTHYGYFWLVRSIALVLLWIAWWASRRYRNVRTLFGFMLVCGIIFAFSLSASGHAADAGDFSTAEILDWLHLLAASIWGGGLFVLSLVVLPGLIGSDTSQKVLIADVARRFSTVAGIFVGVIVITAVYNARHFVGSVRLFWTTPYGLTAAVKAVLLLLLLCLGAFNRYINVPLLQQWAGLPLKGRSIIGRLALYLYSRLRQSQDGQLISSRFKSTVSVEAFLIATVLLCAALLLHQVPARHAAHMAPSPNHMHQQP